MIPGNDDSHAAWKNGSLETCLSAWATAKTVSFLKFYLFKKHADPLLAKDHENYGNDMGFFF